MQSIITQNNRLPSADFIYCKFFYEHKEKVILKKGIFFVTQVSTKKKKMKRKKNNKHLHFSLYSNINEFQ